MDYRKITRILIREIRLLRDENSRLKERLGFLAQARAREKAQARRRVAARMRRGDR
jgi:regulator of replication initiation timing